MNSTAYKQQNPMSEARTGLFLVIAGGMAFAANAFGLALENWWALFILLPATSFHLMARQVAKSEKGGAHAGSRVLNGLSLIVFTVAAMFLLNLDWGQWWPLMLLASGTALFRLGGQTVDSNEHPIGFSFSSMSHWAGLTVILLGLVFLVNQRFGVVLNGRFADFAWWGFFPLIFAAGAFFNAWKSYVRNDYHINGATIVLGFASILFAVSGFSELFNMSWDSLNNIVGLALVAGGSLLILANNRRHAQTQSSVDSDPIKGSVQK